MNAIAKVAPLVPDVSDINVPALTAQEAATVAHDLFQVIIRAQQAFDLMIAPLTEKMTEAQLKVLTAIKESGGTAIIHDSLDVHIEPKMIRDARISVLRQLTDIVPLDELAPGLDLVQPDPEWKTNATQLDKLAKKYGGKVAEIIAEGCPRVESGKPKLVIRAK